MTVQETHLLHSQLQGASHKSKHTHPSFFFFFQGGVRLRRQPWMTETAKNGFVFVWPSFFVFLGGARLSHPDPLSFFVVGLGSRVRLLRMLRVYACMRACVCVCAWHMGALARCVQVLIPQLVPRPVPSHRPPCFFCCCLCRRFIS